jgi:tetratricopeptide (TPR) repeat protein/2-polyprenyl-3-methyl-5-hydroxy-6-metoxy-1,4-benzoquinol methylase
MRKIGRNDPCRCGSGKKYKQCCMQREESPAASRVAEPASVHGVMEAALEHHRAGRLTRAEALYQQVLRVAPNHPDALHFLGVIASQVGKNEIAVELIRKAISIQPDNVQAHSSLGAALKEQGKLDESIACYRRALLLKPDFADVHFNLGNTLREQGNIHEALECYRKALAVKPDFAEAHSNLGAALQEQDRLEEAVACFRKALSLRPHFAEAHYNLGNALKEQGKLEEAVPCYRQALSIKPDHPQAHNNLAMTLREQGMLEEAIVCYRMALSLKPDYAEAHSNLGNALQKLGRYDAAIACYQRALTISETAEAKIGFVACVRNIRPIQDSPEVRRLVIRAISEPWGRPSDLAPACIELVKHDRDIRECIGRASRAWPTRLSGQELYGHDGLASVSADALLKCLLENTPSSDVELERLLTMARFAMLDAATAPDASGAPDGKILAFYCALACQCFVNEYVFAHTDEELGRARLLRERLVDALASGSPVPVLWLAAVAAYFPLGSLPSAEALCDRTWPDAATAVLAQQVLEPAEEQQYRAVVPSLTAIEGDVSRLVRQQYEENPYPRWVKCTPAGRPVSIDAYLRQQFPASPFRPLGRNSDIDILIAGCGTGQHAIETAQLFRGARVLAIDLSMQSLCYAKRKTRERGLENIEYAQADIMTLGSIGRMFDVIESVGVLHHLAEPMSGLRVLVSLLRPGGLMRLGLYSESARKDVVAARNFVARRGYIANAENIRRCRQELMSMQGDVAVARLLSRRDFYGTSPCRDLIFHIQEHRFTLARLGEYLEQLGLHFIGFSLEPHVVKQYAERFPEDKTLSNLDLWNTYELENPDAFSSMYQFWVQKPADPIRSGEHRREA